MANTEPIRVGDKFSDGRNTWEVIRTMPGGKLDLFDRQRTYFQMRYNREVKLWERLSGPTPDPERGEK